MNETTTVTVSETRRTKEKIEKDIITIIRDFERECGIIVYNIYVNRSRVVGNKETSSTLIGVELDIRI
jgi:hypothetical protein